MLAVSAAACAPAAPSPSGAPSTTLPSASADRPDLAAVHVAFSTVVSGLDHPLFVVAAGDGSGRLFVVEQTGRVRVVRGATVDATPFLDLSGRISSGGERGLLGFALEPGFGAAHPRLFVDYTNPDGNTIVSSFTLAANGAAADPTTEQVRLEVDQPYPNHNGGWIGFDATAKLLVALGDGGAGGDPENRASRLDNLLGKMLRLDVLGAPAGSGYVVPPDSPFVGRSGALGEILDYGLRNPWRDWIDPVTGDLWIGDVGQSAWEEIDVARAGAVGLDFGWHRWEGRHCYEPSTGCDATGVTPPVTEYSHADGCAVIGGVVYRGAAIPALRGAYLFSDDCSGTVWAIDAGVDGYRAPMKVASTGKAISSIGTDDAGEVLLTDLGGALLRLVPGA